MQKEYFKMKIFLCAVVSDICFIHSSIFLSIMRTIVHSIIYIYIYIYIIYVYIYIYYICIYIYIIYVYIYIYIYILYMYILNFLSTFNPGHIYSWNQVSNLLSLKGKFYLVCNADKLCTMKKNQAKYQLRENHDTY